MHVPALEQVPVARPRVMWMDVGVAAIAALSYLLIGLGALAVGDLASDEAPAAITYVATACYLAGGLLILLRWRWLWIVGAVVNALVMLFFVMAYADRPSVLFSAGGLATKVPQILLEVGLIYLIVTSSRASAKAEST